MIVLLSSKKGTYDDIQYDLVYLLNLDYYENVDDLGENNWIFSIYRI